MIKKESEISDIIFILPGYRPENLLRALDGCWLGPEAGPEASALPSYKQWYLLAILSTSNPSLSMVFPLELWSSVSTSCDWAVIYASVETAF